MADILIHDLPAACDRNLMVTFSWEELKEIELTTKSIFEETY